MDGEIRRCLKLAAFLHLAGVLFTAAFLLALIVTRDWGLFRVGSCAFYRLTGWYCPGCGGTRALFALLHGDFVRAIVCNPALVYTIIVILWADGCLLAAVISRRARPLSLIRPPLFYAIPVIAIAWDILRNVLAAAGYDPLAAVPEVTGLFF